MKFQLLPPRAQLVQIMQRIYNNGMTTLSGGNLSVMDENGDIWLTPAAIDKGKLTQADIMCVKADGTVLGPHRPSSELPFHRKIYEQRPDVKAVLHAHSPALVSFSIVREVPNTRIIPQARRVCGPVGYAPYALPGSEELGDVIAATFAEGFDAVLLENHGVATAGTDLLAAFQRLETLDFCARTLLQARRLGAIQSLTDEQLASFEHTQHLLPEFVPTLHSTTERELREQIVDIVHRACDRYLMISTEGVVSARVDEHSFLITPTHEDRRSLQVEDLVLVSNGMREASKTPSRAVALHQAIYEQNPELSCIVTAQSPAATAYAIANHHLDTRTIPESYIMLRDMPTLPYGIQFTSPETIASKVSLNQPVVLLQNDCILAVGKSVLQAFDRLEVAEFSAKALLDSLHLGPLQSMDDSSIHALKEAFSLGEP